MCDDLSWSFHCSEIVKKSNKVSNSILHSFLCFDVSVHVKAFNCQLQKKLHNRFQGKDQGLPAMLYVN